MTDIYNAIKLVSDRTIQKLDDTNTPAYPKYYKMVFEDIIESDADESITKIYEKVKTKDEYDDTMLDRYIEFIKLAIDSFSTSNSNIMGVTKEQQEYLNSNKDDFEHQSKYESFIDIITSFQNRILEELINADKRILYLEKRLQEVLVDSLLDPLTKAYNRKALEKDMSLFLDYRRKSPLVVAIVDCDDFKKINDKYGHLIGDKILVFMINTIKHHIGDNARVYRYGGEEFVIIFDGIDYNETYEIIDVIRAKIESSRLIYTHETIKFTISIGMTQYIPDDTFETVINRADKNLYVAKENGKNRVIKG